eukprot:1903952-Pyramimonas_sp.AAC.1
MTLVPRLPFYVSFEVLKRRSCKELLFYTAQAGAEGGGGRGGHGARARQPLLHPALCALVVQLSWAAEHFVFHKDRHPETEVVRRDCRLCEWERSLHQQASLSGILEVRILGLRTAVKPLLSHSTTGELNSTPNYSRTVPAGVP